MALFYDGPISDAADLQRYENSILNVASAESIDLGDEDSASAVRSGERDRLFLVRRSYRRRLPLWDFRHIERPEGCCGDRIRCGQWHVHRTLALIYRDAYNNQLNNRYQGKWAEYEQLAKASARTYFQIGVGLVADPVPQAPVPVLSSVAGTAAGGMFYVAVTWVNGSGDEGAPSDFAQLSTSDGQQLVVTVGAPPQNVTTWNVYAGTSPTTLNLQNPSPLGNEQQLDHDFGTQCQARRCHRANGQRGLLWIIV